MLKPEVCKSKFFAVESQIESKIKIEFQIRIPIIFQTWIRIESIPNPNHILTESEPQISFLNYRLHSNFTNPNRIFKVSNWTSSISQIRIPFLNLQRFQSRIPNWTSFLSDESESNLADLTIESRSRFGFDYRTIRTPLVETTQEKYNRRQTLFWISLNFLNSWTLVFDNWWQIISELINLSLEFVKRSV